MTWSPCLFPPPPSLPLPLSFSHSLMTVVWSCRGAEDLPSLREERERNEGGVENDKTRREKSSLPLSLWGCWLQAVWCLKRGTLRFALCSLPRPVWSLQMSDTHFRRYTPLKRAIIFPPLLYVRLWSRWELGMGGKRQRKWERRERDPCTHTLL